MNHHTPPVHNHASPSSDSKSPALILSPQGSIWSSSPSDRQAWPDMQDNWLQNRPPARDPLQPSHNLPPMQATKDIGSVARGDLLKEYQRVKNEAATESRRQRVGAIGEGRFVGLKPQQPHSPLYNFNLDDMTSERDHQGRFSGLSLDLSSLQIRKPTPSSPQDSGFTSTSTPSLSHVSNTPTTPQESLSSLSSFSAGSTPEDDPNVWVNPALKSQLGRSASIRPDHANDDAQFTGRPRAYGPPYDTSHSESFRIKPYPISPGIFGPSFNGDSVTPPAAARANRGALQSNDILPDVFSQTAWAGSKESIERSKLLGMYGGDPRAELEASMHAFHGASPYSQGRLNLPSSPATHSSTLLSTNDLFSQPKNPQYPTDASAFVPNFPQLPHALTSPTPRPLPPAIAATMGATQVLPPVGLSPRGEILQDVPRPLQGTDALAQPLYSATFDSFPRMQMQNVPTGSPRRLSQETTHNHQIRTPPAPVHEPINFLQMLQPNANPPYDDFVNRIVSYSDQQASVFLQQKMKVASSADRFKIVAAIANRGFEMMTHRFGNWAVQRCLESPCTQEDRMRLIGVVRGRVVELATNCYGTHVIQKALDCEHDIKVLVLRELLLSDPYSTLMNKHAAHVWSRIMELSWSDPAPPIFQCVNDALRGRWADLACHETGSLVVQHAFENLDEEDTRDLVTEVLQSFDRIIRDAWGSWVVQHLLEHGAEQDRARALSLILTSLHTYGTDAQALKSIDKAIKCGGSDVLEKLVNRLCEPGTSKRRAMLVDLALNAAGSQLITLILPLVNREQGTTLYEAIKKHVVTLKGSKSGSRVTWLFDKMRAYYGY